MGIVDILVGAGGGVVGILGALFKQGLEVWQTSKKEEASLLILKEQNTHELLMAEKQKELMEAEYKNKIVLAETSVEGLVKEAAYKAMEASYEADKPTYSVGDNSQYHGWLVFVDVYRGTVRPNLTYFFAAVITLFAVWIVMRVPTEVLVSEKFLTSTFYSIISALIFLATTSAGWWFASRPSSNSNSNS